MQDRKDVEKSATNLPAVRPAHGTLGPYELLLELAQSKDATCFAAQRDHGSGIRRLVTIKAFEAALSRRPAFANALRAEVRVQSSIDHPYVCRVFDMGIDGDTHYVESEYLVGESLARVLALPKPEYSRQSVHWSVAAVARLCEGLHAAHQATEQLAEASAVAHGNLSPSNLFVLYDGTVRVADYGVTRDARATWAARPDVSGYRAPEAVRGDSLDRRADIWSMGVVLWELLSGRPFSRQVNGSAIPLPSRFNICVPPAVDAIVMRALQTERERRYQTAEDFSDALDGVLTNHFGHHSNAALGTRLDALFPGSRRFRQRVVADVDAVFEQSQRISIAACHAAQGEEAVTRAGGSRTPARAARVASQEASAAPRSGVMPWLRRLFALLLFASSFQAAGAAAQAACASEASVCASPQHVTVSSRDTSLLNALLSSLTVSSVSLSAGEFQALADTQLSLFALTSTLKQVVSVGSLVEAAQSGVSLTQLYDVAAEAADTESATAAAAALRQLSGSLSTVPGAIRLGDVLSLDFRPEVLAQSTANALDLVTSAAQAHNQQHASSVQGVTLLGSSLGLSSLLSSVEIAAVAVSSPLSATGPVGTLVRSGGVRLRVRAELSEVTASLSVLGFNAVTLRLQHLDLVVETAPGSFVIDAVDALSQTLSGGALPGAANLALGTISDAALLDRAAPIELGKIAPGVLGQVDAEVGLLQGSASLSARSFAAGAAGALTPLSFAAPFARTERAVIAPDYQAALVSSLLSNLMVTLGAFSGGLSPSSGLLSSLQAAVVTQLTTSSLLQTAVDGVLSGVVSPALDGFGGGLGTLAITTSAPFFPATGAACSDGLFCTGSDLCDGAGACVAGDFPCAVDSGSCTSQTCIESTDSCDTTVLAGCTIESSCYGVGARNPEDACEACVPSQSSSAFSPDLGNCDSDGDGVADLFEQSASGEDLDTDGDMIANRYDADDDGDGVPTADEAADPNGDGDPEDARDSNRDGLPDYLDPAFPGSAGDAGANGESDGGASGSDAGSRSGGEGDDAGGAVSEGADAGVAAPTSGAGEGADAASEAALVLFTQRLEGGGGCALSPDGGRSGTRLALLLALSGLLFVRRRRRVADGSAGRWH